MGREEDAKEEASPRIVNDGVGAPSKMRSAFGHGTVNMLAVGPVAAVMKAGAGGPATLLVVRSTAQRMIEGQPVLEVRPTQQMAE